MSDVARRARQRGLRYEVRCSTHGTPIAFRIEGSDEWFESLGAAVAAWYDPSGPCQSPSLDDLLVCVRCGWSREVHPSYGRRRGFLVGSNQRSRRLPDAQRLRIRDGVRRAMRRLP